MAGADRARVDEMMARQDKYRRRVTLAERTNLLQRVEHVLRRAFCRKRGVDLQAFLVAQAKDISGGAFLEKRPQGAEILALDGDPGGHRMAASLDDQPFVGRLAHQPPEIKTRNRASG